MPDVIPVIAELCGVQELSEENIRNTGVAKGSPGGTGEQLFYKQHWTYFSISRPG